MNLIEEANKIVNGRNDIYPPISDRTLGYICSGVDIKLERTADVIKKIRSLGEDPMGMVELDSNSKDTLIDLMAYLQSLGIRIK
jgi:hypothetical protein